MNVFTSLFVHLHLWILDECGNWGLRNTSTITALATRTHTDVIFTTYLGKVVIPVYQDDLGCYQIPPF